jgi:hypothetical protein
MDDNYNVTLVWVLVLLAFLASPAGKQFRLKFLAATAWDETHGRRPFLADPDPGGAHDVTVQ